MKHSIDLVVFVSLFASQYLPVEVSDAQVIVGEPAKLEDDQMNALREVLQSIGVLDFVKVDVLLIQHAYVAKVSLEPVSFGYGARQGFVECTSWSRDQWECEPPAFQVTVNFRDRLLWVSGFEHPSEALFLMDNVLDSAERNCAEYGFAGPVDSVAKMDNQRYLLSSPSRSYTVAWDYRSAPRVVECGWVLE